MPSIKKINCQWSGDSLSKLSISYLKNLEDLDCSRNQLTELTITDCPNLKVLDCSRNKLTELDLTNFKQLKQLKVNGNNFSEQDLSLLKNLNISSENSKIKQQNVNFQYEAVIFLCHGLGSSASNHQATAEQLQRELPYNIKFILPQAPTIKVDFVAISGAKISPQRPSWYNIISFEDVRSGNNDHGLLASVAEINKIIDQEIAKGIKPENIFVAGLSQGGSLALAIGLTSERKLGGIIGWAAFTPYQKVLQEKLTDISREIPFFLMHGCVDRIVEYKVSKEAKDFLQQNGYSLHFRSYFNVGHDHKLMMNDTINLLKKQLTNKGLSPKTSVEETNIEIVEIKEREVIEAKIEISLKN